MKARSKHAQLQRYTRNWATHEIMKTLIKNKRSYKKRIAPEEDDRDSFMEGVEELERDGDEGRDEDEEGSDENGDEGRDGDKEGNEEGNGEHYEGGWNGDVGGGEGEDMYTEEGENGKKEGNTSFEGNGDEEVGDDVGVRLAVGQRKEAYPRDLGWDAAAGFGATTSQSAAAKKSKKLAATSKSVGKFRFKPAAVGLAGTKRKVPEDEDHGADQVAAATGRRNPARNIREPKKLRL